MAERNRLQLFRTPTPGKAPLLSEILVGELSLNLSDKDLYMSTGTEIVHLNAAANIKTDATHRFVTDAQLESFVAPATETTLGLVKVGSNIVLNEGTISLEIASSTKTGLLSATDYAAFAGKQNALGYLPLDVAGGTMSGPLVLAGAPNTDNDAANKLYVDQADALTVKKTGSTMTGLLVLSADPEQGLGAATKQYVDSKVDQVSGEFNGPVQSLTELTAIAIGGLTDKQMRLVEDTGSLFRFDMTSSATVDNVGVVAPDDVVTTGRWIKIQAATQNHEQLNGLLGGAAGDHLHLTTAEKNAYDGHIDDTAIHMSLQQSTLLGALNVTAAELNYSAGVTSAVQTQLDAKQTNLGYTPVNLAGDTMTGALALSGAPTLPAHAVSLEYLQSFVVDCGTF